MRPEEQATLQRLKRLRVTVYRELLLRADRLDRETGEEMDRLYGSKP